PLTGPIDQPQVVVLGIACLFGFLADAEPFEPAEHRPVIDAGTRGIVDPRLGLDQAYPDPGLRQPERGHEARRPAADHDHLVHSSSLPAQACRIDGWSAKPLSPRRPSA